MPVRSVLLVVAVALVSLVAVESASACSCRGDVKPKAALAAADAGIVGEVVSRLDESGESEDQFDDEVVITFRRLGRSEKGGKLPRLVKARTAANGGLCGLGTPVGERLGVLLYRRAGGGYDANSCGTLTPRQMCRRGGSYAPTGAQGGRRPVCAAGRVSVRGARERRLRGRGPSCLRSAFSRYST